MGILEIGKNSQFQYKHIHKEHFKFQLDFALALSTIKCDLNTMGLFTSTT